LVCELVTTNFTESNSELATGRLASCLLGPWVGNDEFHGVRVNLPLVYLWAICLVGEFELVMMNFTESDSELCTSRLAICLLGMRV
jgi:hypothetical protein